MITISLEEAIEKSIKLLLENKMEKEAKWVTYSANVDELKSFMREYYFRTDAKTDEFLK